VYKIISIFFLIIYSGCGIYSFSGVNLEGAETVSFKYFDNSAPVVNPDLSILMYDEMQTKFVSQTTLDYVQRDADIFFDGVITNYDIKPIDIKAGETASYNRLTITVKVTFKNFKNPKYNFENKTFTWYADYESSKNLADVEADLIETITEKIIDDIFNASVVNW